MTINVVCLDCGIKLFAVCHICGASDNVVYTDNENLAKRLKDTEGEIRRLRELISTAKITFDNITHLTTDL